ncbi:alpha/beta hydrolase [Halobacteriales archaeon Cl-PHB]
MTDPHADQPVETAGVPLAEADAAAILVHGRGASARGFLEFASALNVDGVTYLAPQAARGTWYPNRFVAPIESNEPWLSSALSFLQRVVDRVTDAGIGREDLVLVGFSQGGCLASDYVARNPTRYGGLAALSGGLIGPEGTTFDYEGDLVETPVFLGCSDSDPHIPVERVHETLDTFEGMNGDVTERIYEGMGHTINRDEQQRVADLVAAVAES